MSRFLWVAAALALSAPTAAQVDWSHAQRVQVQLSNFKFAPRDLRLQAGQPTVLHLVNETEGGHDFTAPEFFAAADVKEEDRPDARDGSIEVPSGQSRDIALIPARGRYKLKCSHMLHTTFGMKGEIFVD
jgi:uncharacterized cupredoxin-like copper-binding protein